MSMQTLYSAYQGGKIEKRVFLSLMRERFNAITEYASYLEENDACESIEINKKGIILTNALGVKVFFDFRQTMCRAEFMYYLKGDGEDSCVRFITSLLKTGDIFFDIGANVGLFSLAVNSLSARMGGGGVLFYDFEPLPPTFEMMKKTLMINNISEDVIKPFNIGFSNQCGSFDFYYPGNSEAASLQPITDDFYIKNKNGTQEKVRCSVSKLDSFCNEQKIKRLDFMKIDVEGNEKFVLEGGLETIEAFRPMVYCEMLRKHAKRFGYHPNEIIMMMSKLGYECFYYENEKLHIFEQMDENTTFTNFFFFHKEKHLNIIKKFT